MSAPGGVCLEGVSTLGVSALGGMSASGSVCSGWVCSGGCGGIPAYTEADTFQGQNHRHL